MNSIECSCLVCDKNKVDIDTRKFSLFFWISSGERRVLIDGKSTTLFLFSGVQKCKSRNILSLSVGYLR